MGSSSVRFSRVRPLLPGARDEGEPEGIGVAEASRTILPRPMRAGFILVSLQRNND